MPWRIAASARVGLVLKPYHLVSSIRRRNAPLTRDFIWQLQKATAEADVPSVRKNQDLMHLEWRARCFLRVFSRGQSIPPGDFYTAYRDKEGGAPNHESKLWSTTGVRYVDTHHSTACHLSNQVPKPLPSSTYHSSSQGPASPSVSFSTKSS